MPERNEVREEPKPAPAPAPAPRQPEPSGYDIGSSRVEVSDSDLPPFLRRPLKR